MKITKKDINKRVRLRNGDICRIGEEVDNSTSWKMFYLSNTQKVFDDGKISKPGKCNLDVIAKLKPRKKRKKVV